MKYAVLFIALLFAGCGDGSSTVGYEIKIDGSTIQVAKEDFPSTMSRDEAMKACEGLGNGWRLPSVGELKAMYEQLQKQGKGNFKNTWYWSSSQDGSDYAWSVNFFNGDVGGNGNVDGGSDFYFNKFINFQVRAVRAF